MSPNELANVAAKAALDKKAARVTILEMTGKADLCDYQLICSADNERQSVAIADAIEERCRASGARPVAIEGKQSGNWVLLDYGSVIAHVFINTTRDYYALETLWPSARKTEVNG